MLPVQLFTNDGGFVASGRIPPFLSGLEPHVVVWGDRTFCLARHESTRDPAAPLLKYVDVFAVALVDVDPIDSDAY
jgi:hypothetical protein